MVTSDNTDGKTEPTERTGIVEPLAVLTDMGEDGGTQFCSIER